MRYSYKLYVMNMSYKPVQWNWLAFYTRGTRMYSILSQRLEEKYKHILYYRTFTSKSYKYHDSDRFFIFKEKPFSLLRAILHNDIDNAKKAYAQRESHLIEYLVQECASLEICNTCQ